MPTRPTLKSSAQCNRCLATFSPRCSDEHCYDGHRPWNAGASRKCNRAHTPTDQHPDCSDVVQPDIADLRRSWQWCGSGARSFSAACAEHDSTKQHRRRVEHRSSDAGGTWTDRKPGVQFCRLAHRGIDHGRLLHRCAGYIGAQHACASRRACSTRRSAMSMSSLARTAAIHLFPMRPISQAATSSPRSQRPSATSTSAVRRVLKRRRSSRAEWARHRPSLRRSKPPSSRQRWISAAVSGCRAGF